MQTIKTAVVVVMLLAVLYGAYVALNGSDTPLPAGFGESDLTNLDGPAGMEEPGPFSPDESSLAKLMPSAPVQTSEPPKLEFPSIAMSDKQLNPNPFPTLGSVPKTPAKMIATPATDSGSPNLEPYADNLAQPEPNSPSTAFPSLPELSLPNLPSADSYSKQTSNEPTTPSLDASLESELDSSYPSMEDDGQDPDLVIASDLPNSVTSRSYENAKKLAFEQIGQGKLKEALSTLSVFYNSPELTSQQVYELLDILDPLAGEVIYSRRHLLDIPHEVGPGETIESIAKQYEIQPELLSRINALEEGRTPPIGTKLKIIPGPFRAEVDLKHNEMTMFVGELYAGRFAISLGQDPPPREGVYQVVGKQLNRNYYGQGGSQIAGTDPRNPYGGYWIDLGHGLCIHGSPAEAGSPTAAVANDRFGCISLSPIDARDVYGMLGFDCKVQIKNNR